jgi:hypothetical protein
VVCVCGCGWVGGWVGERATHLGDAVEVPNARKNGQVEHAVPQTRCTDKRSKHFVSESGGEE